MNNLINTLFLCAHYALYCYLISLIYKRFVRPYLVYEQQQQRAFMIQLEQKLSSIQLLNDTFRQQVEYLTDIFKKIACQQDKARAVSKQFEHEQVQRLSRINADYQAQQNIIMHNRALINLYQEVTPEVIARIRSELASYSQFHGKEVLNKALTTLKEQSRSGHKKKL